MTDKCIFKRFAAAARNRIYSKNLVSVLSVSGSVALYFVRFVVLFGLIVSSSSGGNLFAQSVAVSEGAGASLKFDEDKSFEHLENVCAFGRRFSTSRGMRQQQDYLRKHFESLGVQVFMQPFVSRNPRDGRQVELANMIVRFHPHRSKRLLICCHYDTRPFPDPEGL